MIRHDGRGIFVGLSNPFEATRYHSLTIDPATLPAEFEVSARSEDDASEIMAIRHRALPLDGVQFHPESFLTLEGPRLLANFLGIRYAPAATT
jgi:anthranilate synthase/aminodeoxychorismate synthase-like glutamine amidotransferase